MKIKLATVALVALAATLTACGRGATPPRPQSVTPLSATLTLDTYQPCEDEPGDRTCVLYEDAAGTSTGHPGFVLIHHPITDPVPQPAPWCHVRDSATDCLSINHP